MGELGFEIKIMPHHPMEPPKDIVANIMSQVMSRVHGTLRRHQLTSVGLSFAGWSRSKTSGEETLGDRMLICSTSADEISDIFQMLDLEDLEMAGAVAISSLIAIPEHAERRHFYRERKKERMLKLMKGGKWRHGDAPESTQWHYPSMVIKKAVGHFQMTVGCDDASGVEDGEFNSYGLSRQRSVPVFEVEP